VAHNGLAWTGLYLLITYRLTPKHYSREVNEYVTSSDLVDNEMVGESVGVGDDRSVTVDDPEQRRGWWLGSDITLDADVWVAQVRVCRTTRYLRRIYDEMFNTYV